MDIDEGHEDIENTANDHDLLILVAHDGRRALRQLQKQNGRIAVLEKWQQRVLYTAAGAGLMSPLAFQDVRTFLAQILGG